MLTLIEAISLAGDRGKQNDDAWGALGACAWVIDGATDLDGPPLSKAASDAAWIAQELNISLYDLAAAMDPGGADEDDIRFFGLRNASQRAMADFSRFPGFVDAERWRLPTASALAVSDYEGALVGADLGDCRCFVLDATGAARTLGGHDSDDEARTAADALKRTGGGGPLRDATTLEILRRKRASHNQPGGYWVFGLQPECADHARTWSAELARPAHLLLCTDGFSALVDRYQAHDATGLVRLALDKGLQELGRELRAIEAADAGGAKHPRFKSSDDATAVLLRLT